ncbi:MAG: hypothetical protein AAGJ81_12135 [Verrucomicrobiota bacterium]
MKKFVLLSTLLLAASGCQKKNEFELPGLTDANATAIALNDKGDVIDFVHVTPDSGIDWIEFHAPTDGSVVQVLAVGKSLHPDFPSEMIVSSKIAEGFMGKVTVEVEDGMITSIAGNSVSFGNPLSMEDAERIRAQINEEREYLPTTVIVQENKFLSNLVEDTDGNLVPGDMSDEQKVFVSQLLSALEKSDDEELSSFVHKDEDDSSGIDTILSFLKYVSNEDIKRYRFMRFDAEHPDNQSELQDMDGNYYRYSLPIDWVMTLYFSDSDSPMQHSADLFIGSDSGQLKVPTKYAE